MLWPLERPAQITLCLFAVLAILVVTLVPARKRAATIGGYLLLSCLLFVPSCLGIMAVLDEFRFGTFEYATYQEVKDFRVERFLPPSATEILLKKSSMGHLAKYSISEPQLGEFIDELWESYGKSSAVPRNQEPKLTPIIYEWEAMFGDQDWTTPGSLIEFHSPTERDGGGAHYFYDRDTGIAYHKAGYW